MPFTFRALLHAAALTPTAVFAAQPAATDQSSGPGASTPLVTYESVFTGYRPFSDEKLAPWREVNDEVGRVGGQAGIFGGAGHGGAKSVTNTPTPAVTAPQAPPPMHSPGHQGMKK